jgi:hypothetical protein
MDDSGTTVYSTIRCPSPEKRDAPGRSIRLPKRVAIRVIRGIRAKINLLFSAIFAP